MSARVRIPEKLAAEVMFNSNRTCCICRDSSRKTQIHHVDSNPSNNDLSNLAVICGDCHSDAHTTHAFARNLTSDLIRKYNENWQTIVRARLSVGGEESLQIEYQQQVLLEISLAPHAWKNHYMALNPGHFQDTGYSSAANGGDVWDLLSKVALHKYSVDEWKKLCVSLRRSN